MRFEIPTDGIEQLIASLGFDGAKDMLKGRAVSLLMDSIDAEMEKYAERREARQGNRIVGSPASAKNKQRPTESPAKRARQQKPARDRELMTFRRKGSVTEGHLTILHSKLIDEGWIDGIEGDFKALFSGERDEACCVTWLGKYGNGTLVELFRQLVGEGLVIVPKGYSLPYILEGHFKDQEGKWLTRLDKGDKANEKALPVIEECVDLLKMNVKQLLQKLRGDMMDGDEDFQSKYDPFDHQDLNIHKWK